MFVCLHRCNCACASHSKAASVIWHQFGIVDLDLRPPICLVRRSVDPLSVCLQSTSAPIQPSVFLCALGTIELCSSFISIIHGRLCWWLSWWKANHWRHLARQRIERTRKKFRVDLLLLSALLLLMLLSCSLVEKTSNKSTLDCTKLRNSINHEEAQRSRLTSGKNAPTGRCNLIELCHALGCSILGSYCEFRAEAIEWSLE